jgi:putative oxidoreductase
MKITILILRTLMGLLFVFGALVFLFDLMPMPELTGKSKLFMDGVSATGFFMPFVKITELVCGVAFISGYYVPLAAIVISPVILNILLFAFFVDNSAIPVAIFLVIANSSLGYFHWEKFKYLMKNR